MEIWNEEHTRILTENEIDLTKGCVYYIEEENYGFYHIFNQRDLTLAQRVQLEEQIDSIKIFLSETDYVVIKIYEATISNQDTNALKTQYADILTQRATLRSQIDVLEQRIKDLLGNEL